MGAFLVFTNESVAADCNYRLAMFDAWDNFVVLNLTAYVGYKVYRVCFNMASFMKDGLLAKKRVIKLRKFILITALVLANTGILLYFILCSIHWA